MKHRTEKIRFARSNRRSPNQRRYALKGIASLTRSGHRYGPLRTSHGTLYFIVEGGFGFEFHGLKQSVFVSAGHFLWVPPLTSRTGWTKPSGVVAHALLLEETTNAYDHGVWLEMPTRPEIFEATNPKYITTLFQMAEQRSLQGSLGDRTAAEGLSLVIIGEWLRSCSERHIPPYTKLVVQNVLDYISYHFNQTDLDVDELVRLTPWSRQYFFRAFKQVTGKSPQRYLRDTRLNRALELLKLGDLSVSDVARRCGFKDSAYFSRVFTKSMGKPPSIIREMHLR